MGGVAWRGVAWGAATLVRWPCAPLDAALAAATAAPARRKEADEVVEIGYLNALFVVARSIGLVGHALDQKRLQQPLYRHPWDDVLYTA